MGQKLSKNLNFFKTQFLLIFMTKIIASLTLSQEGIQPQGWALQYVLNDSFVCYQDLSEYVGL